MVGSEWAFVEVGMRHQNARIEHDRAFQRVITGLLTDHTKLFKQISGHDSFKKWLSNTVFCLTNRR